MILALVPRVNPLKPLKFVLRCFNFISFSQVSRAGPGKRKRDCRQSHELTGKASGSLKAERLGAIGRSQPTVAKK